MVFIGVNVQDTEPLRPRVPRRFGVTYPNGRDATGAISVDYGMSGVPESYFVDRSGQLVRKWQGPLDDARLRAVPGRAADVSADPVVSVGWLLAFGAGLLSFFSPCVVPIVPGYLSLVSGVAIGAEPVSRRQTERVVVASVLFVLGFTVVFVALGAAAGLLGGLLDGARPTLHAHRPAC